MRTETYTYRDTIEIKVIGEKKELAKIEIYHWNILKELGLNLEDLLRIAFGNG